MTNKSWTTWFVSDPHFGHGNVINFCDRPFKDVEEMEETIINNINKVAKPEDLIVFVGDMFFYRTKDQMKETMNRIVCKRKILVKGNHDSTARIMMNSGFDLCVDSMTMTIAGEKVFISHYPFGMPNWKYNLIVKKNKFLRWITGKSRQIYPYRYHEYRPENKGQFLIHGHTHDKDKTRGKAIHVGVDAWNYKPVNIQDVANLINRIRQSEKDKKKLKRTSVFSKILKQLSRRFHIRRR